MGSRPRTASQAAAVLVQSATWLLSSAAPRAYRRGRLDDRLEGRFVPELERIDGLYVVVGVDDDGRGAIGMEPVGVDDRLTVGRRNLDVLETGPPERFGDPLSGTAAVLGMLR